MNDIKSASYGIDPPNSPPMTVTILALVISKRLRCLSRPIASSVGMSHIHTIGRRTNNKNDARYEHQDVDKKRLSVPSAGHGQHYRIQPNTHI